jgi:hypothetical protein
MSSDNGHKRLPPPDYKQPDIPFAAEDHDEDERVGRLVAKGAAILRDVVSLYASRTDPAALIGTHSLNGAAESLERAAAKPDTLTVTFAIVEARYLLLKNVWLYHDLVQRNLAPYDDGLREAYDQSIQMVDDILDAYAAADS